MNDSPDYQEAHTDFRHSLSYGGYLALDDLLSLQRPLTDAHDEMLFIVIHQVSELWMRQVIHELRSAMQLLEEGRIDPSLKMLTRVVRAQEQMTNAWEVLKTMTPADYLEFRSAFGAASGFQSYQYRMVEFLLGNRNPFMLRPFAHEAQRHAELEAALRAPSLYDLSLRLLDRQGFELPAAVLERDFSRPYEPHPEVLAAWLEVYRHTSKHWDLYYLAEKLVDVEDNFRRWRFNHLTTVERMIGFKRGSGGTAGVGYLRKAIETVLFPELWQVRTEL
ncbi:tryptophan 2,3-dioxygenase [Deinobacterium chartae]|uniref:Tryptophan 2,3-dioxygenase n=1 Tax=Deinobacterium chartae TaxID=521158 RepID=A0A841HX89_9DEIO|nr:tryptophan 2,3-dioxygenase [Deinobacterium chartae]MBB6096820.1 tryptophan 2,3-dioxygenase [Deinobacterium chartae]